jgi:2-polyprenyl-3-methyl-5-hydroxy-6-metoxy-1,4-benzoquinol methylase
LKKNFFAVLTKKTLVENNFANLADDSGYYSKEHLFNNMEQYQKYFAANKQLWNHRTVVHKDSSFYDMPSFLNGKTALKEIELKELGDVMGKKILHLQCHFGMDTLSLARMGAKVTGVDLSDTAIDEAKKLNIDLGLDAEFICCNIYDLHTQVTESTKASLFGGGLEGAFDIVFTSYGVIGCPI